MVQDQLSIVSTAFQCAGLGLVTVLFVILLGTVRRSFLRDWTLGWGCMTLFLLATLGGFLSMTLHPVAFTVYCFFEYCAAYFWLTGCRHLANDTGPIRREIWLVVPALALASGLPLTMRNLNGLIAVHMLV